METEKQTPTLADIPAPPVGSTFKLDKIEKVAMPHPYCIGPKHLEYADSMYLNAETIEHAERKGAKCCICKEQGKNLSFKEHETSLTLFISVQQNRDLNAIPGLHAYLLSIKRAASELGIQGFAFPLGGHRGFPKGD